MATLRRPFRPCSVRLRGRRLARRLWSYDRRARVLRAHFKVQARHAGGAAVRRPPPRVESPDGPVVHHPPRGAPASRGQLAEDSPLLGGPLTSGAGAESPRAPRPAYDPRDDDLELPRPEPAEPDAPDPRELRELIPARDPGRALDDWGRSQRIFDLIQPALDFYYRYWFRVEQEGIENVPSEGGALLVSNHSGALPPDAPMIMQAHPPRAPVAAAALHARRALVQGLPGRGPAHEQDGRGARPPRQRPAPAGRRAAAGAGVPRGA